MALLEFSQILFNIVVSMAVLVVATMAGVIAYDIIKFTRAVKKFMDGVNKESQEVYNKINNFLEAVFSMAIFSRILKKKNGKK